MVVEALVVNQHLCMNSLRNAKQDKNKISVTFMQVKIVFENMYYWKCGKV